MEKIDQKNNDWVNRLVDLLDTRFEGPFGLRFGLDGLLGLIPVVGDATTSLMSLSIVGFAYRQGYPAGVIVRMLLNILVENVFATLPLLGNIFDFFWKSNVRNLKLIRAYERAPEKAQRHSRILLISLLILFGILIVGTLALAAFIAVKVFEWLGA